MSLSSFFLQKADRILFHCDVGKDQLTWTSPQNIETQMSKLANFVWTEPKGLTTVRLRPDTRGAFVDVDFVRSSKRAQVSFNLTERVLVLSNGLVSLMNTTMTLFTDAQGGGYADWKMSGKGKETIMGKYLNYKIVCKCVPPFTIESEEVPDESIKTLGVLKATAQHR